MDALDWLAAGSRAAALQKPGNLDRTRSALYLRQVSFNPKEKDTMTGGTSHRNHVVFAHNENG